MCWSWYPVPILTPASCAGVMDMNGAIVESPSICLRVIVKVAVCGAAIVDEPLDLLAGHGEGRWDTAARR